MSKGFDAGIDRETLPAGEESFSTAQEAVPVPLWWGKTRVAVRWITPIVSQEAVEAQDRPVKK